MVKTHPPLLAAGSSTATPIASQNPEAASLRSELDRMEEQIEFYQSQIDKRDAEITRLQKSCQGLSDRNQMLEQIIQQLPEVYRQKFTERLDSVKSRVQSLQNENRRLSAELQQVSTRQLPEARLGQKFSLAEKSSLPEPQTSTSLSNAGLETPNLSAASPSSTSSSGPAETDS